MYRHVTDKLPTSYRHITNCRPTVGRLSADCRPTHSLYFGENLSAVCRSTVGRQTANKRPTVGRQTANSRPTVGQQTADSRPTVGRQVFWGALLHNYRWIGLPKSSEKIPRSTKFSCSYSSHDLIGCLNEPSGKLCFKIRGNCK